jgi:cytoskeletal protein CcmA (bactofilin family)
MSTASSALNSPRPDGDRGSHLGHGVRIQGKIFSDQDLQIDGQVDGTLEAAGHNLTIGSQAKVKADIRAQNVSIVGAVEGTIETSDLVELCSQCRVVGQIKTRRIAVQDGAYFKGDIEVVQASVVAARPRGPEVAIIEMSKKEPSEADSNELLATA